MELKLQEIQDFVSRYSLFDTLPEEAVVKSVQQIEISCFKAGASVLKYGDPIHHLYIIRNGIVEVYRRKGLLHNRLDQGDIFGEMGLLMNNRVCLPATAIEDTLVYLLPEQMLNHLVDNYEEFADFVELEDRGRLHQAIDVETGNEPDNNIETENMSDFKRRNLKDAFQILSNAQKFIKFRYHANPFSRPITPVFQ